jgi:hypothetical protein
MLGYSAYVDGTLWEVWAALKTDKVLYLMRSSYKACVTPNATVIGKFLPPASCWFLACLILLSWRWRRRVPQKHRLTFNELHSVISQKIQLFIATALGTSNPTSWQSIWVVFLNSSRHYRGVSPIRPARLPSKPLSIYQSTYYSTLYNPDTGNVVWWPTKQSCYHWVRSKSIVQQTWLLACLGKLGIVTKRWGIGHSINYKVKVKVVSKFLTRNMEAPSVCWETGSSQTQMTADGCRLLYILTLSPPPPSPVFLAISNPVPPILMYI